MPGICPWCAISRRQMRQRPNLRYTERERPQRAQRLYARVLNFAGRAWRTRWEVFATLLLLIFGGVRFRLRRLLVGRRLLRRDLIAAGGGRCVAGVLHFGAGLWHRL